MVRRLLLRETGTHKTHSVEYISVKIAPEGDKKKNEKSRAVPTEPRSKTEMLPFQLLDLHYLKAG